MKKFNDDTFLARWLNGELTEDERVAFESSDDYSIYQQIIAGTELYKTPDNFDAEAMLAKVKGKEQKSGRILLFRIAAAIALIMMSYFAFDYFSLVRYHTEIGEKKSIGLPDGTEVTLNAVSTLSYARWGWSNDRSVSLNGEAYFEVEKGSTFKVETKEGIVKVLGTKFNVKNSPGLLEVFCFEGRVQVQTKNQDKLLTATRGLRDLNGDITDLQSNGVIPEWINNTSSFRNVPVAYVFEDLEKQYGLEFRGAVPQDRQFTGTFPHDDLELALNIVLGTLRIDYQIKNNVVELQSE